MSEDKSSEKAVASREDGNKFYNARSFHKAMLKYNESLCFAEVGSKNVGHAFANRSAVYFEMKIFEKCLKNIEMAKQNNYFEEQIEILTKREEKARSSIHSEKKAAESFFKLSHPPNKKLPFIIQSLEMKEDKKYGRHIITNEPLRVGDIVAIEKPFCSVLLSESNFVKVPESNILQRCTNCLKDNALDLIPCPSCCKAMFCSTECLESALERYHRFECPVMDRLIKSGSVHMALRLFFIGLSAFDGSVENFKNFFEENEGARSTIFNVDEKSSVIDQEKSRLLALFSLTKSSKNFSTVQHEEILMKHPILSESWKTHREFIQTFIQRQSQISDHNFHGIFSGSTKQENFDPKTIFTNLQQSIGSGSMLFCSLINHSCSSNILRVCFEGKIVVVVCRPIAKGSQLFDCYNANFMRQPKIERQEKLLREFGFVCECEACSNNFPTPPALTFKDVKLLKVAKKNDDEILQIQLNQARKKFFDCCDLLEKNHQNYPCIELFLLQKCIASFFLRQARPVLFP